MKSPVIVNGSQRMMLHWEQAAPLNACHLLELGPNCPVTWEQFHNLVPSVLQSLGIGDLDANAQSLHYEIEANASVYEVDRVAGPREFDRCLEEAIERELQRPFLGRSCPIRWLWIEEADRTGGKAPRRAILATYRHAVADSVSIRLVCRQLIAACCGRSVQGPFPIYANPLWSDLRRGSQPPRFLGLLRYVVLEQLGLARSLFPRTRSSTPQERPIVRLHADRVPVSQLRESARSLGVSVQSLLFAATFEALLREPSSQKPGWLRSSLALQCPVDLRKFLGPPMPLQFGQMLGVYLVRIAARGPLGFQDLVAETHRQLESHKTRNSAAYYPWAMALLSKLQRWFPRRSGTGLPLLGGLSNANLNEEFRPEFEAGELIHYSRTTYQANVLPMMLSITSFGDEVSFLSTRRESFLDDESLARIVSQIARRCRDVADEPTHANTLTQRQPIEPQPAFSGLPAGGAKTAPGALDRPVQGPE